MRPSINVEHSCRLMHERTLCERYVANDFLLLLSWCGGGGVDGVVLID